jgi:hypothetical protein
MLLYSVKAMSKVFRAKFVAELRFNHLGCQSLYDKLFSKDWVIYAKIGNFCKKKAKLNGLVQHNFSSLVLRTRRKLSCWQQTGFHFVSSSLLGFCLVSKTFAISTRLKS